MGNKRSGMTILMMLLLWVAACALTAAVFLALVDADGRSFSFYTVLAILCFAEALFFGFAAYTSVNGETMTMDPAARITIQWLLGVWCIVLGATGLIGVLPKVAETFWGRNIILIQMLVSFLFVAGIYFFYAQSGQVQEKMEEKRQDRRQVDRYGQDLARMIATIRRLGAKHPDHLTRIDRLIKKIEMVKGQLAGIAPSSVLVLDGHVRELNEAVESLERAAAGDVTDALAKCETIVLDCESALANPDSAIA